MKPLFSQGQLQSLRNFADSPTERDLLELIELQTRALLAVEWRGPRCAWCEEISWNQNGKHFQDCPVDAALTAAGLPDQASRDAKRNERRTCRNGERCGCPPGGVCPCACHEARARDAEALAAKTVDASDAQIERAGYAIIDDSGRPRRGHPGACKIIDAGPRHCSHGTKGCRQG